MINTNTIMRIFNDYLNRAKKMSYINKPYAWALYHTWKYVDKHEKEASNE